MKAALNVCITYLAGSHASIHPCMDACVHTYVPTRMRAWVRACVRAYLPTYLHALVLMHKPSFVHGLSTKQHDIDTHQGSKFRFSLSQLNLICYRTNEIAATCWPWGNLTVYSLEMYYSAGRSLKHP